MNPTGFSTNSTTSLQNPKLQQQFFPQMEANPGHLYGGSNPNPGWDLWAPNNPAVFNSGGGASSSVYSSAAAGYGGYEQLSLYSGSGDGSGFNPDPHLVCLKLGKRQYYGDNFPASGEREVAVGKRSCVGRSAVPRCQVEGCHVSLTTAKDYHRRHKVCEVHSKAPKVVVLGLEQRFCQQCSRFHVVSEFDESKRSCRRRLAGHNQRRRKSSFDSLPRSSSHEKLTSGKLTKEGALSLLSTRASGWDINASSPSEISSRSSAALRELIAENRAAILSKNLHHNYSFNQGHQLPHDYQSYGYNYHQFLADQNPTDWERQEAAVTLDLMQAPTASAFGLLSESRLKHKGDEAEECDVVWNAWNGVNHD